MTPTEDKAFIETQMVHGRASRRPMRRWGGFLVLGFGLVATSVALGSGWVSDGSDEALFTLPGGLPVAESQMLGMYVGAVGVWMFVWTVRRYRRDRALARRARG